MIEILETLDENLAYHDHEVYSGHIDIFVHSTRKSVLCSLCGESSSRIHSRYPRVPSHYTANIWYQTASFIIMHLKRYDSHSKKGRNEQV
jgi:hypothetical protein